MAPCFALGGVFVVHYYPQYTTVQLIFRLCLSIQFDSKIKTEEKNTKTKKHQTKLAVGDENSLSILILVAYYYRSCHYTQSKWENFQENNNNNINKIIMSQLITESLQLAKLNSHTVTVTVILHSIILTFDVCKKIEL